MRWSITALAVGKLGSTSISPQVFQTIIMLCHIGNLVCFLVLLLLVIVSEDISEGMRLQSVNISLRRAR
eukprot:4717285-Karenia_brevis.AAC.1